jgi:type IV pilus assembly protein PilB
MCGGMLRAAAGDTSGGAGGFGGGASGGQAGQAGRKAAGLTDLDSITVEPDAIHCISDEIARKYNVLPIRVEENKLYVAMAEPVNVLAVDDIRFITKKAVVPVPADAAVISRKIDVCFSRQRSVKALEDLKNEYRHAPEGGPGSIGFGISQGVGAASGAGAGGGASAGSGGARRQTEGAEDSELSNAPAVRLTNSILNQSVTMKASDIHLEPFFDSVRVRYRVDGSLIENMTIPSELYSAVSTRIKIMAGMDIAERRLPQDGRIEMSIDVCACDIRLSSLPTVFGAQIEIRKLDRSGFSFERGMLGFSERETRLIDDVIRVPHGIVLVTGPTGSGKTTTIYSLLHELNKIEKNIVTIEDPVEYMIRGINQVQVNTKAGLTFAGGLRSILRQDPDIIMVGEIRDEETAEIAVRAAITGHLVLSTLHTNDAPGSIVRLMDMGIQPYLLSEAVTCVIAQRLVRKLCVHCRTEREANETEMALLRLDAPAKIYEPTGCPQCNQIGYLGRHAIHEVFYIDSSVKLEIEQARSTGKLREMAVESGMTTLLDNCRALVLDGRTSIQELVNTVYARE